MASPENADGISLLVPCFNAAAYLPRLFASVSAQRAPFAEVLLYDDGSTDQTIAVATELGARIIRGEGSQRGPSVGRNVLARAARCDWIHFHDADDIFLPSFVERLGAEAAPSVDAVGSNVDWVDEATRALEIPFHYSAAAAAADPLTYFLSQPMSALGVLYRRSTFLQLGGFDESMRCWEDADLNVRLAAAGARFRIVEEVHCQALRNGHGLSSNQAACYGCRLEFLRRYAATLPARLQPAIAAEAEKAAVELLHHGDRDAARQAVALAQRLGRRVPSTQSAALRAARFFLPPLLLLDAQRRVRRR